MAPALPRPYSGPSLAFQVPALADLYVTAKADLASAITRQDAVRFEGVAVGVGIYTAQDGSRIAIEPSHLPLIADRIAGVQIRDLHDERVRATVGVVRGARVHGEDVLFEGEVALQPHATIVRRFPETIAFSVGFRFRREDLVFDGSGVAPLPLDFTIDHLAIVGQGQDPDARLTRLLNQAAAHPNQGMDPMENTRELDRLRHERDQALQTAEKAKADLAVAKADLGKTTDQLERTKLDLEQAREAAEQLRTEATESGEAVAAAEGAAEAARLELAQAKSHFAASIIKLELRAGNDVDLDQRRDDLLTMDLGQLDKLRLDLAEKAAEAAEPAAEPATRPAQPASRAGAKPQALDLEALSIEDTLRLGLVKGAI